MPNILDTVPLVDVDSHISEPRDLWSSRMASKYTDIAPEVIFDPNADEFRWRVGDVLLTAETEYANAGWHEHFPSHPPTLAEANPACYDSAARLRELDASGVWAQVLYPNLIGFDSHTFVSELGSEAATDAVRAYNDFQHEFASADPRRLVPIAMVPYWDLEAASAEIRRTRELGFTGVLLAALLSRLGYKNLSDPYWDPMLATIQDLGMSVNLHVGFNQQSRDRASDIYVRRTKTALAKRTNRLSFVKMLSAGPNSVVEATADLILQGTFDRFPRLTVVSVESGFGWVPYMLDNLDWHWQTSAANHEYPARKLPSEYWMQHFLSTFWFEHSSLPLLEAFQDNVMFETDFPHETGVFMGPWGHNITPRDLVKRNLDGIISDAAAAKVLSGNAAKLYGLELPQVDHA